jgi:hypothetical protein
MLVLFDNYLVVWKELFFLLSLCYTLSVANELFFLFLFLFFSVVPSVRPSLHLLLLQAMRTWVL